jgi:hypothetical protein
MKTILLTGGSGRIGRCLRYALRDDYRMVLFNRSAIDDLDDAVDDALLLIQTGGAISPPFARQGFIMKALAEPQPRRSARRCDAFPFFVAN